MDKSRLFFLLGAIAAFLAVAIGSFGAHSITLDPEPMQAFKTGTLYHLVHALALLAVAYAYATWPGRAIVVAGICFAAGIVLFSGAMYAYALTGMSLLGAVIPVGGVLFLLGWGTLAWAVLARSRPTPPPGNRRPA